MKQIKQSLEAIHAKIEALIGQREDYYNNRSDAWQDSGKASEYQDKTELLTDVLDNIDYAIGWIDRYLETY